jgi:ADP-ribosylglycohydrolase
MSSLPSTAGRIRGCLLGGAVGDALGAPIEFASWREIRSRHGDRGVTGVLAPGHFTDDTQMTLFTCEGLIAAA